MVHYSENQLFAKIFQEFANNGLTQLLLEDIHLVININAKILLFQEKEQLKWSTQTKLMEKKTVYKVADFEGKGGCALGMYNTHFSIENFAHNCF